MPRFLRRSLLVAITPVVAACSFTTDFSGLAGQASGDGGSLPIEGGRPDADAATADAPTTDAPSGGYRDLVIADRPLAYWRLGDTGTIAKDEVGANDGQYVGMVAHGPGIPGADSAAVFDGAAYIDVGNGFGFEDRATYSVEAWIMPSASAADTACVIAKNEGAASQSPKNGWAVYLDAPPGRGLNASRFFDGAEEGALSSTIPTTKLTHVVATYDGARTAIWLDGKLATEKSVAFSLVPVTNHLTIGASRGGSACRFRGTIDELAVYGAPLAKARIEAHYQRGLTP